MTPKIVSLCELPKQVRDLFAQEFDFTEASLGELHDSGFSKCNTLLLSIETRLGRNEIARLPNRIKTVATYSVGLDHIDQNALKENSISLINTPGVLSDAVAENAVFLTLAVARRATESIDLIRSQQWPGWSPAQLIGTEIYKKTVGIVGMGRIGCGIAKRFEGLGANIAYTDQTKLSTEVVGSATYFADLDDLLSTSDFVILACPSTDSTRGLISAKTLASMKASAILINIARGDLVNDNDLIEALSSHKILGAGLDVFNNEPKLDPRYFELPNLFMMPHIGSSTIEARLRMGQILVEGLRALSIGETPPNIVA